MKYWRMQLHPDDAQNASRYSIESIAAGFIGLDFATKVGDLLSDASQDVLPTQKDYLNFFERNIHWRQSLYYRTSFSICSSRG